jgi:flagellar basal body rod protein FlgC
MPPINAALKGLTAAERRVERCASRLARAVSVGGAGDDSVSLSEEAVGLLEARNAYEMNLQVLKVSDQMTKKLIDFLA